MIAWTLLGFTTGCVLTVVTMLFSAPIPVVASVVIFSPAIEELFRASTFVLAYRTRVFAASVSPGAAAGFGFGFALVEAIPRWRTGSSSGLALFWDAVAPFAAILLHVFLSLLFFLFLRADRAVSGALTCFALHAAYNGYVWLVVRHYSAPTVMIELPARLMISIGLIVWLVMQTSKHGLPLRSGNLRARTDVNAEDQHS